MPCVVLVLPEVIMRLVVGFLELLKKRLESMGNVEESDLRNLLKGFEMKLEDAKRKEYKTCVHARMKYIKNTVLKKPECLLGSELQPFDSE